jgi:myosin heavy subunit
VNQPADYDTNLLTSIFCRPYVNSCTGNKESSKVQDNGNATTTSSSSSSSSSTGDHCSICVLDIFGFESSAENGLEQLLINFANQALQTTFDRQVFQAEAELYKREGLSMKVDQRIPPPQSNVECMVLLNGIPKGRKLGKAHASHLGILGVIDAESAMPQPSDKKLITHLHSAFGSSNTQSTKKKKNNKSNCFGAVHLKDRQVAFVVEHYAGNVTYVVGSFLLKNKDHVPPESDECMLTTTNSLVDHIWRTGLTRSSCPVAATATPPSSHGSTVASGRGQPKPKRRQTIVSEFRVQMDRLIDTLEATRCSFIRCVKPNAAMVRNDNDESWFDAQFVTRQLRCLSVPQTVAVLRSGFPTRIAYSHLSTLYSQWLPSKAIKVGSICRCLWMCYS